MNNSHSQNRDDVRGNDASRLNKVAPSDSDGEAASTAEEIPSPTYVPAALAMGIMMLLWGILTNWLMSLAGALLMVWAIQAWIRELHQT